MEDIWRELAIHVKSGIGQLKDQAPGCVEDGGLSKEQERWIIRRLTRPPYEAVVQLRQFSILIEHDFRVSSIHSHGDIETTVIDVCCDDGIQVYLAIDGERVDISQLSRIILYPIVTGNKP